MRLEITALVLGNRVNPCGADVDSSGSDKIASLMSREVLIGERKFWVVSEPDEQGWKAQVLEVVDAQGATQNMGIETTGETRGVADERAVGQLQHRLRDQSS
jgi:hypothetical protein